MDLAVGDVVQWEDPDAGNHADGCPGERETHYIGPVDRITVRDGEAVVFLKGGVKTDADDQYLSEPDQWLRAAFENSEFDTYMWYEEHWEHLHDAYGPSRCPWPCEFGDGEIERRTSGA